MNSTIIALSGSHGTGKRTVLNALAENNNYKVDDFEAARFVMEKLGTSIKEFTSRGESYIIEFQEETLLAKASCDSSLSDSLYPVIFVERCLSDLVAYSRLWNTGTEAYESWLTDYTSRCNRLQNRKIGRCKIYLQLLRSNSLLGNDTSRNSFRSTSR